MLADAYHELYGLMSIESYGGNVGDNGSIEHEQWARTSNALIYVI